VWIFVINGTDISFPFQMHVSCLVSGALKMKSVCRVHVCVCIIHDFNKLLVIILIIYNNKFKYMEML